MANSLWATDLNLAKHTLDWGLDPESTQSLGNQLWASTHWTGGLHLAAFTLDSTVSGRARVELGAHSFDWHM